MNVAEIPKKYFKAILWGNATLAKAAIREIESDGFQLGTLYFLGADDDNAFFMTRTPSGAEEEFNVGDLADLPEYILDGFLDEDDFQKIWVLSVETGYPMFGVSRY